MRALFCVACVLKYLQGNLSAPTTRLLRAVLPARCLWTSLRDVEGLSFDATIKALKELYPASDGDDNDDVDADPRPHGLSGAVPEAVLSMVRHQGAVEALGSMIWYLRTLNIDREILTMKNFYVYDPMKKGQGLVLDGQTLAHIEVCTSRRFVCVILLTVLSGSGQQRRHG